MSDLSRKAFLSQALVGPAALSAVFDDEQLESIKGDAVVVGFTYEGETMALGFKMEQIKPKHRQQAFEFLLHEFRSKFLGKVIFKEGLYIP